MSTELKRLNKRLRGFDLDKDRAVHLAQALSCVRHLDALHREHVYGCGEMLIVPSEHPKRFASAPAAMFSYLGSPGAMCAERSGAA